MARGETLLKRMPLIDANNSFARVLIPLKVLFTVLNLNNEKLFNGSCILYNHAAVLAV